MFVAGWSQKTPKMLNSSNNVFRRLPFKKGALIKPIVVNTRIWARVIENLESLVDPLGRLVCGEDDDREDDQAQ